MKRKFKPIHQPNEPIPREIEARLTKPRVLQPLFQVNVDVKGSRRSLPVGPKIGYEAAEMILVAVNGQIALGKIPGWGNARLEAATTSQGA